MGPKETWARSNETRLANDKQPMMIETRGAHGTSEKPSVDLSTPAVAKRIEAARKRDEADARWNAKQHAKNMNIDAAATHVSVSTHTTQ